MTCPPGGNKGLPINLSGPLTANILSSISGPKSLEFQAAPRATFPTIDSNGVIDETGSTTIRMEGHYYSLAAVQLTTPAHLGYDLPGTTTQSAIAELCLWAKPKQAQQPWLLFSIFVRPGGETNDEGQYLRAALWQSTSFRGSIRDTLSENSISYETCIQLALMSEDDSVAPVLSTQPVRVFVFPSGITLGAEDQKALTKLGTLPAFGIPLSILPEATVGVIKGASSTAAAITDSPDGVLTRVYNTLASVGSDNFTNRFRYLPKTFFPISKKNKNAVSAFKCRPLDPEKDIRIIGGKKVVMMGSGGSGGDLGLDSVLTDMSGSSIPTVSGGSIAGNATTIVAIVIGSVIGFLLASMGLWFLFKYLVRSPTYGASASASLQPPAASVVPVPSAPSPSASGSSASGRSPSLLNMFPPSLPFFI